MAEHNATSDTPKYERIANFTDNKCVARRSVLFRRRVYSFRDIVRIRDDKLRREMARGDPSILT